MTKDEIESFITQFPIYQYQFLKPDEIEYNDRVRTICKKECPRYGTSWSCPPAVGTVEECMERCHQYDDVLFFSSIAQVQDVMDLKESLATKAEHEKMTHLIEQYLREHQVDTYTLSSDSCAACDKCAYPKAACRHPEQMFPCIESHGIIVANLVEKFAMDYFLGEQYIVWFSLIFFKNSERQTSTHTVEETPEDSAEYESLQETEEPLSAGDVPEGEESQALVDDQENEESQPFENDQEGKERQTDETDQDGQKPGTASKV